MGGYADKRNFNIKMSGNEGKIVRTHAPRSQGILRSHSLSGPYIHGVYNISTPQHWPSCPDYSIGVSRTGCVCLHVYTHTPRTHVKKDASTPRIFHIVLMICPAHLISSLRQLSQMDSEAMGSMREHGRAETSAYTEPSSRQTREGAGDQSAPLLYRRIIKDAIELHARHYDLLKPMASPATESTTARINRIQQEKERGGEVR
jgi:hypothetical protein